MKNTENKKTSMKTKLIVILTLALTVVGLTVSLNNSMNSAAANSPFVGTWTTKWKTTDGREVSAPVIIRKDTGKATDLDGSVEVPGANGGMFGSLSADGKTWSGKWYNPDGVYGTFTFTIKDNKTFEGSYTQNGYSDSYYWNGSK